MRIYIAIITFLLLLAPVFTHAQVTMEADAAFEHEQFSTAIDLYKKASGKTKNKLEKKRIAFQISECYRYTKDTRRAEQQYRRLVSMKYSDPIVFLYYAECLRDQGKYEEAIEKYKEYTKMVPEDPRGTLGAETMKLAIQWIDNPNTNYEVENIRKINSRADDFSPTYADRKFKSIIFSSSRKDTDNDEDPNTGLGYTWLYITNQDQKGNWARPVNLDEEKMLNTKNENNGSATFNRKFNTIYFTRCHVQKNAMVGCDVYTSSRKGKNWTEPKPLNITADSIRSGHPAIYNNERTMFFTSDLPKGYGGRDIWVVERRRKSKPFGKPKNLGENINTTGDERYPIIHKTADREHTYLYFASNGRGGMGGWDMFRSELVNDTFRVAENLGYPLNSPSDDFGIIFSKSRKLKKQLRTRQIIQCEEKGFITTNREGGRGRFDIWEFWLPEIVFTIAGTIRDEQTLQYIPQAKIVLSGSDGTVLVTNTDQRGYYFFNEEQINKKTTYTLKVTHAGHFENEGTETTVGRTESENLILNLTLEPIPPEPIPLPEIRYDLAKWDLKPQYQDSLNGLIKTMQDNPTLVIELGSHTDYQDATEKNNVLSYKRAKSVVDFLVTKGIDGGRMVPKGYGENVPRTLPNGYKFTDGKFSGVEFPEGTVLTEEYIKRTLRSTKQRKAANQLNRRTEFKILRTDYVPKNSNDSLMATIQMNPEDNKVSYVIANDTMFAECILNNNTYSFALEENVKGINVSLDVVMGLIAQHRLNVMSFETGKSAFTEDGTIKDGEKFFIQRIRIGNKTVYDVTGTCTHGGAPIVIGKEALSEFSNYTIDKTEKKIIFE
ncbi:MAG: OmpA family protein [Bacteroidales bacterium]|nr:OmpA family protein [Bacteroidales bacterium]